MYPSYSPLPYEVHVSQNLIRTALRHWHRRAGSAEHRQCYIYRNIIDMTAQVPTVDRREGMPAVTTPGNPMGDHGSPPWSAMWIYHNTVHTLSGGRSAERA